MTIQNRGTGRTTRLAAEYLQYVLKHPGQWVTIADHHDSAVAADYLTQLVSRLLRELDVEHERRIQGIKVKIL